MFLGNCSKEHLFKITEEYDIDLSGVGDKRLKGNVKAMAKLQPIKVGVLLAVVEMNERNKHYEKPLICL